MKLVNNSIWAINPDSLEEVENFDTTVDIKTAEEIQAAVKRATSFKNIKGNIAVLPLYGTITHRITLFSMLFGTSTEQFSRWFDAAVADTSIGAIVIDVNSPGGETAGVEELTEKIYKARGVKPIIAVVNSCMASAAYWIGSAADEIVMTPSGEIGSIGVFAVHEDKSEEAKAAGIKYTIIRAGEHKAEINPVEPLSKETREYLQSRVDERYNKFTKDIARNRNITANVVKSDYGKGRLLFAEEALQIGMIDKIGTLERVLINLFPEEKKNNKRNIARAKLEIEKRR